MLPTGGLLGKKDKKDRDKDKDKENRDINAPEQNGIDSELNSSGEEKSFKDKDKDKKAKVVNSLSIFFYRLRLL